MPEFEAASLLAQFLHMAWLLEVAGWFAGLLDLVELTAPLKIAGLARLAWFQVAAGFSFLFLFFFFGWRKHFREGSFSLDSMFPYHFPMSKKKAKKEDDTVDFLQVDKLSLVKRKGTTIFTRRIVIFETYTDNCSKHLLIL